MNSVGCFKLYVFTSVKKELQSDNSFPSVSVIPVKYFHVYRKSFSLNREINLSVPMKTPFVKGVVKAQEVELLGQPMVYLLLSTQCASERSGGFGCTSLSLPKAICQSGEKLA